MPELRGSKTHENLMEAFAGESQANRRYIYFARKADIEGEPDIAARPVGWRSADGRSSTRRAGKRTRRPGRDRPRGRRRPRGRMWRARSPATGTALGPRLHP
jgi:Rubrerythrin